MTAVRPSPSSHLARVLRVARAVLLGLTAAAALPGTLYASEGSATARPRALLISSYHPGFPTFFRQIEGLRAVLEPRGVLLDVEFMDSKRFTGPENRDHFLRALAFKLAHAKPYDIVLTADDNALQFVLAERAALLPTQPVVFFGVNDPAVARAAAKNDDVTGVVEAVSMRETIQLAIELFPGARRVVAIVDETPSSRANQHEFEHLAIDFPDQQFSLFSLETRSFEELMADLSALEKDSVALLLSAYVDRTGRRLLFDESLALIDESLNRPLFHLWRHGIGDGVVGGRVISHEHQARAAAEMAVRILSGESPSAIPLRAESPNVTMVDHDVMRRHHLDSSALPADTIIVNAPESFYTRYTVQIWLAIAFLLSQTAVILFLVRLVRIRKRTEVALRESEERASKLFTESRSVMLLIDPLTGGIVDANASAYRFYGYDRDALLALNIKDINRLPPKDVDEAMESAESGAVETFRFRHQLADGNERDVEVHTGPITVGGRKLLYSIIHDVTERVRAETERERLATRLQQAEKMEAIGTLAGGIAHDFNNILAIMNGYTEMIILDTEGQPRVQDAADNILAAGHRARDLVQQILAFSRRSAASRQQLRPVEVVTNTLKMLRHTLPSTIDIVRELDPDTPEVFLDPTHLDQITMNLCTNAYQALEEKGGVIRVRLESRTVGANEVAHEQDMEPGRFMVLTVSDDGPGVPPAIQREVFDPFFTTKPVDKGTGMGLAIVHGIARQYGGMVTLESEPERGATFRVFLPLANQPEAGAAALEPMARTRPTHVSGRVLLVDDEPLVVKMTAALLESLGYEVTPAHGSREALAAFDAAPDSFSLVLSDQTMPKMTGLELAEALTSRRPDLPFVLATGYSSTLNPSRARAAGVRSIIKKPFSRATLAETLSDVLS